MCLYISEKDVDDLRKQMQKMSTGGATKRDNLFTHFTPGSHMVLSEGGRTDADQVEFKSYHVG